MRRAVRPVRDQPPGAPAVPAALDALAGELAREGWSIVARYEGTPPLLKVFSAEAPFVGESVTVVAGRYVSSTGHELGTDPVATVRAITRMLGPVVAAARGSVVRDGAADGLVHGALERGDQ